LSQPRRAQRTIDPAAARIGLNGAAVQQGLLELGATTLNPRLFPGEVEALGCRRDCALPRRMSDSGDKANIADVYCHIRF